MEKTNVPQFNRMKWIELYNNKAIKYPRRHKANIMANEARAHITIERMSSRYISEAANVLVQALWDKPVAHAAFNGVSERSLKSRMQRVYAGVLLTALRAGQVRIIRRHGQIVAVNIAYPPQAYPPKLIGRITNDIGALSNGIYGWRYASYEHFLKKIHPQTNHWYLHTQAVRPDYQGCGVGEAMLEYTHDLCDKERLPCYLETDRDSAVQYYEKYGYEICDSQVVPNLPSVTVWTMQRSPQKRARAK